MMRTEKSYDVAIVGASIAGRPYNAIERPMYSAAARDERSARHFHAFGSLLIGVREFLAPRAVARALRHAAGQRRSIERPEKALAGRAG